MEFVFDKIAEIEKKAQGILDETEVESNLLQKKLEDEFAKLDATYDEKLKKLVAEKTEIEEKNTNEIVDELCAEHSAKISELKAYFEENTDKWEEKIFTNITE